MVKRILYMVITCMLVIALAGTPSYAEESKELPRNGAFTPLITTLVNATTTAAYMKNLCRIGNGRVSNEFIQNQSVVDNMAIQQVLELGYNQQVAEAYLAQWKEKIHEAITYQKSKDHLFCNGDFAMFVTNFYRNFSSNPEVIIAEIEKELGIDEKEAERQEAYKALDMIGDLK